MCNFIIKMVNKIIILFLIGNYLNAFHLEKIFIIQYYKFIVHFYRIMADSKFCKAYDDR